MWYNSGIKFIDKIFEFYNVVETTKENKSDPFRYLNYLFEELPNIDTTDQIKLDQLLHILKLSFIFIITLSNI